MASLKLYSFVRVRMHWTIRWTNLLNKSLSELIGFFQMNSFWRHYPLLTECTGHNIDSHKAFVKDDFCSPGKAMQRFRCREKSNSHRAASSITRYANAGVNVVTVLSATKQKQLTTEKQELRWSSTHIREVCSKLKTSLLVLMRQGRLNHR